MKLLTWNILASEWIKPTYYPTVTKWSLDNNRRIEVIIDTIKRINPDVILLQEVMPMEHRKIKRNFREYWISPISKVDWGDIKSQSGNVTAVRKSIPVNDYTPFNFGIKVELNDIVIYNIHLDDIDWRKRLHQLKSLDKTAGRLIIAGDFNQEYRPDALLWMDMKVNNTRYKTYFIGNPMNIDNVITKGLSVKTVESLPLPNNENDGLLKYGSDHLPVISILNT